MLMPFLREEIARGKVEVKALIMRATEIIPVVHKVSISLQGVFPIIVSSQQASAPCHFLQYC